MNTPTYLSPSEVSERYGIPEQTLANWRYQGRGPAFIKLGGLVRYSDADLTAWEDAHRVSPS
jgi:predicted DNA-binding transcriptional regulator AlpA